jgi:hypothetical protein
VVDGGRLGETLLFADAQQVLPPAEFAFEPHALGDLKRRYNAALELLPALSGALAN